MMLCSLMQNAYRLHIVLDVQNAT